MSAPSSRFAEYANFGAIPAPPKVQVAPAAVRAARSVPKPVQMRKDGTQEEECPICFNMKPDVKVLEHWESQGDISTHRMCSDCRLAYAQDSCPFCRALLSSSNVLKFIKDFIGLVSARKSSGQNERAAVLEEWQLFEMMHAGSPGDIARVCQLVLDDDALLKQLENAYHSKSWWVHDIAGIIFRLHAMAAEGEVDVDDSVKALLEGCVEFCVFSGFEVQAPHVSSGHETGALYTQAIGAWLSARESGMKEEVLIGLVRRSARALEHCYKKWGATKQKSREINERLHEQYMKATHGSIWPSQEEDPVWGIVKR